MEKILIAVDKVHLNFKNIRLLDEREKYWILFLTILEYQIELM